MAVIWLMLVQTETSGGSSPPVATVQLVPERRCRPDTDGDIVVCGRVDNSLYRLQKLPDQYQRDNDGLPRARHVLGDGSTVSAETEQVDVGGFPSKRLMLRWKKGF